VAERWATFDCYGTLIDWNAGLRRELVRLFGEGEAPRLLERYHELEPEVQREDPTRTYRGVMTEVMRRVGAPAREESGLADSLPSWEAFPEVPEALTRLRERGWRLALLSNSDPDLLAASRERIGVPFELGVVASEIGSYKPAHGHWERFFAETGADRGRYVHVAASAFHDIAPCVELGLPSVWINRLGEPVGPEPARELPTLDDLPETLDELVPA
jgi:2-haloacid dehalogenase